MLAELNLLNTVKVTERAPYILQKEKLRIVRPNESDAEKAARK